MSSSSKTQSELELPVFITPVELLFSNNHRKTYLTIFNPYDNDAHFSLMTTSPNRFDVSISIGIIKPQRRIDVVIRLVNNAIGDLPQPMDEPKVIDYFKISLQVGKLKGIKPVKVQWCTDIADEVTDKQPLMTRSRSKAKLSQDRNPINGPSFQNSRLEPVRHKRNSSVETTHDFSANLICTICAISCVIILFLPISLDSDLCEKVKSVNNQNLPASNISSFLTNLLSVSYEMKLGCSFALGLFTYRLITSLPN